MKVVKFNLTMERQNKMDKYRLLHDIPCAKAGTIFVHDKEDTERGSNAEGCLKLAWDENGNCQNSLCADTIVFHVQVIRNGEWFEKVTESKIRTRLTVAINSLEKALGELKEELK